MLIFRIFSFLLFFSYAVRGKCVLPNELRGSFWQLLVEIDHKCVLYKVALVASGLPQLLKSAQQMLSTFEVAVNLEKSLTKIMK